MPMVFGSTLSSPCRLSFFFITFFQAYMLPLGVSVSSGLGYASVSFWLGLQLGFIFYIQFVSTKPTALPSCITYCYVTGGV